MQKVYSKCRLGSEPRERDYWTDKSYQERINALETLMKPYRAGHKFQRVLRITRIKKTAKVNKKT